MLKKEIKCPKCGADENFIYLQDTTIGGLCILHCNYCDYVWKSLFSPIKIVTCNTYNYPLELKEHAQYLKDGTKLTDQDKYDLQIDLWRYGKE